MSPESESVVESAPIVVPRETFSFTVVGFSVMFVGVEFVGNEYILVCPALVQFASFKVAPMATLVPSLDKETEKPD